MKTLMHYIIVGLLLVVMFITEGCTGCSHRQRRLRENRRQRTERIDHDDEDRCDYTERDRKEYNKRSKYSAEHIRALADSDDYDLMLDAMFNQLSELKNLKKEYFKGNLPDKEAERRVDEINKNYEPVTEKLSKASSDGLLTYNQHKRQLKLAGEYFKLMNSILKRFGKDIESELFNN